MGYEFNRVPLGIEFYNDGKLYFKIMGNENMIFKFDMDTEKMYIASFPDIDNMQFVAEREKEFILISKGDESNIVTLSKDSQLIFTELDRDRINALFEEIFKQQKTPEEQEEENRKAMEEFQKYLDSLDNSSVHYITPLIPPY